MGQIRSEKFRETLMRLMDGDARLTHAVHHINNMKHGPEIAAWLLRHGYKGTRLFDYQRERYGGSVIEMAKGIVAEVNRTNGVKPMLVGGEYLAR